MTSVWPRVSKQGDPQGDTCKIIRPRISKRETSKETSGVKCTKCNKKGDQQEGISMQRKNKEVETSEKHPAEYLTE